MLRRRIRLLIVLFVVATACEHGALVHAQELPSQWSNPQPLLVMPSGDNGTIPNVFTGQSGNAYLLFFGRPDGANDSIYSLYYSRWVEGNWQPIKDVVVTPDGGMPETVVGVEDASGYLHVFWTGSTAWYSKAHVNEAENPRAWTQPVGVFDQGQVLSLAAVADANGAIHLLLTTTNRDVYSLSLSADGTPGDPVLVYHVDSHYPHYTSLVLTNSGKLIGCWNDVNGVEDGRARGALCATSNDGGASWTLPEDIATGHYWGGIFYFAATNTLARIIGGGTGVGGRTIELSQDDGASWLPSADLTQGAEMGGYNNHVAAIDSADNMHVLVNPGDGKHVHSSLRNSVWTPNTPAGWSAWDWISMTTAQGNTMVATWWLNNTVFVSSLQVDAPLVIPGELPPPLPTALPQAVSGNVNPIIGDAAATTSDQTTSIPQRFLAALPFVQTLGRSTLLFLSVLPALVLVLMVVVWQAIRVRR